MRFADPQKFWSAEGCGCLAEGREKVCVWIAVTSSGGFRRKPSRLPPLGDGLTPSLTVMLANAEF